MTFSRKIFISVFLSTLILGSGLIVSGHYYVENLLADRFTSSYQVITNILADTLKRLDSNTESLMMNAAKVVAASEKADANITNEKLRLLRDELGVTHLFLTDKTGKFTHSTNEDPKLIPNLFSFCDNYPKLISGELDVEATPIIKPDPEPKPYKFLSIPNHNRTKIIEVGVRVDFIAKTLIEAIKADSNILSLSLFAPDGTPFGRFGADGIEFKGGKETFPSKDNEVFESSNGFKMFTKVGSSHNKCCQCDKAGTSKNGNYFYVIKSDVSKAELKSVQATAKSIFLFIGLCNIILAFVLSKILSRSLVRNIEYASERVKEIKRDESLSGRIRLEGGDEVAYLTKEFDALLETLENSQRKVLEAEMVNAKVKLAREVGHNIRSPIVAIEMMLPMMLNVPERLKKVLKTSVKEIKSLSEKLAESNTTFVNASMDQQASTEILFVPTFIDEVVNQKTIEYKKNTSMRIEFQCVGDISKQFIKFNALELKSILSNLVNNSVESLGSTSGSIIVRCKEEGGYVFIQVIDDGPGIPEEYLDRLGEEAITFKGEKGRGTGLVSAFFKIRSAGEDISIQSKVGKGTIVTIKMKGEVAGLLDLEHSSNLDI